MVKPLADQLSSCEKARPDWLIEELKRALILDAVAGRLTWAVRPADQFLTEASWKGFNVRNAGREALTGRGGNGCNGCITISGDKFALKRARVIWAMHHGHWPTGEIGHRNSDFWDDRISNLREQTEFQRAAFARRAGKTGVKGVYPLRAGKFGAHIIHHGSKVFLGSFDTEEAAILVRQEVDAKLNGEFARSAGANEGSKESSL